MIVGSVVNGLLKTHKFGCFASPRSCPFQSLVLSIGAICLCFLDIVKQRKRSDIALYVMLLGIGYFILTLNWIAEPFSSTFDLMRG